MVVSILTFPQEVLFERETPIPAGPNATFCAVQTYYLPSPPPSAESAESSPDSSPSQRQAQRHVSVVQASPKRILSRDVSTFRRRVGRGGRIRIDRRWPAFDPLPEVEENANEHMKFVYDRMKYDREEDGYPPVYHVDINSDA